MEHSFSLISTIAAGFGVALLFGFIAERLRIPALVGYLVAGICIGPATPGFVTDVGIASQLSEIGVMLLMFGVGLHFSIGDLLAVRRIALPGAIVQMTCATALGMTMAWFWGWSPGSGLIFGLSLSCASTVVLLKALEAKGIIDTMNGRIAIGWLVVEDLVCVLVLVLMPPLASLLGNTETISTASTPLWMTVSKTLLEVSAFVVLMLVIGRRMLPRMLWYVARTGSRELFTLSVLASAIVIAYVASIVFSVSFALGAFFAGMVMRESEFSHRAAKESLPLRDAFSVLFFVSVGMLFEPSIMIEQPLRLLEVIAVIIVGKTLAALALVLIFRYPLNTALTVAVSLAQIGEFSFILAGLGLSLGLIPSEGMSLVLAGALLSIALNPFFFAAIEPMRRWLLARSPLARRLDRRHDPLAELPMSTARRYLEGQVVIVGHGRVGRHIVARLKEQRIPLIVVEQNREMVESLRRQGIAAVCGDAAEPVVLVQAHIAEAAMLIVATQSPLDLRRMVDTVRTLNPDIQIIARTETEDERELLHRDGLGIAFVSEETLSRAMADHVLQQYAKSSDDQADDDAT